MVAGCADLDWKRTPSFRSPLEKTQSCPAPGYIMPCTHPTPRVVNPYLNIRAYHCTNCGLIAYCACERDLHELEPRESMRTRDSDTGLEVDVQGFEDRICPPCRGQSPAPFPRAETIHESSKFRRYYWRELSHESTRRAARLLRERGEDVKSPWTKLSEEERATIHESVERELRETHERAPTFTMQEPSQEEVLSACGVEVVPLKATYVERGSRRALLLDADEEISVELFVQRYYERQGYAVTFLESRPWHALFAVFVWCVVNDPFDPRNRIAGFGDRRAFDRREKPEIVWMHFPDDFGSKGYGQRRRQALVDHFALIKWDREFLLWVFDYWAQHGDDLRNYLWAHDEEVLRRARRLVETLEPEALRRALEYLFADYWGHFLGWPDLMATRGDEHFFVEVKSSKDRLSGEQKRWIQDNHATLHLPFKIVKVHRANPKRRGSEASSAATA